MMWIRFRELHAAPIRNPALGRAVGEAVAVLGVAASFHPFGSNQECEGAWTMDWPSIGSRFAAIAASKRRGRA